MVELLPRLRRFAYALSGTMEAADDLVQEACVRALAKADQWDTSTRLDSWMYRIAQNAWYDKLRSTRSRGEVLDSEAAADVVDLDGRDVTESRLTLAAVVKCIGKLPADQQLVLLMVCIDGLSYKDTADALNIPIGTVMSRLARARRMLQAATDGEIAPGSIAKVESGS